MRDAAVVESVERQSLAVFAALRWYFGAGGCALGGAAAPGHRRSQKYISGRARAAGSQHTGSVRWCIMYVCHSEGVTYGKTLIHPFYMIHHRTCTPTAARALSALTAFARRLLGCFERAKK